MGNNAEEREAMGSIDKLGNVKLASDSNSDSC